MSKTKELGKYAAATGVGAAVGAVTSSIIGGMGLAVGGTAVGITLAPLMAIGGGIGLAGFGLYKLGKAIGGKSRGTDSQGK